MAHLAKNLAALGAEFSALAARLQAAGVPEGFAPTTGSDGTETFCRVLAKATGKCREWLGATSMPAASAAAIIAALDAPSGGANGLGLSIGTGYEWAAFAGRLGRAQLVYVYEPDAGLLRMALEICDLSALLGQRRIVLLTGTGDTAAEALAGFLAANPGFEPPTVLHPLPTLGERRAQFLAAGEAIVRHAVMAHQTALAGLRQRVAAAIARPQPPRAPQVLALLLTPRYAAERPIQHAAATRSARIIPVDRHDAAGTALRLGMLADMLEAGPAEILSDLFRHQLAPLPQEIPVETWVPPLTGPAFWERLPAAGALAPHDRIVVHFSHHAQLLKDRGIPAAHIRHRPLHQCWRPPARPPHAGLALRHRIALIADLPATDPAALGIGLPTHLAVFAAAREMIEADYLTVHPGMAGNLLRRALGRAGVDPGVDDPALQEPMLRIIASVLIPAIPPLTLAAALARENMALTLIGDWPGLQTPAGAEVRVLPFEAYDPDAWNDVAVAAYLSPQGAFSPLLLDAIASRIPIVAPVHPADGDWVATLKPDVEFARSPAKTFIATLKSLLRDASRREKIAAAALQRLAPAE